MRLIGVGFFLAGTAVAYHMGQSNRLAADKVDLIGQAQAAGGVLTGSNTVAPKRYVYYPGTETLAEDEVRVIACGTGGGAAALDPTSSVNFRDVRYRYFDLGRSLENHSFETEGAHAFSPRFKLTNKLIGINTDRGAKLRARVPDIHPKCDSPHPDETVQDQREICYRWGISDLCVLKLPRRIIRV